VAHSIKFFPGRARLAADWIIPGWLKRQNTGFLIGPPKKACKSWLLLNLGWDLSDGTSVWAVQYSTGVPVFKPPRVMRTVYFTQEDSEDDVQDRAEIMLLGNRVPNDHLWIVTKNLNLRLDTPENALLIQKELDEVVKKAGPIDLVMFDPMRRIHSLDENDSSAMAKIWQAVDIIHRRYNCATLFSHHIIKPPTHKGNLFDPTSPYAARGSGDIYGAADAFANVNPVAAGKGGQPTQYQYVELHFVAKRSQAPQSVLLRVEFATGSVKFDGFI
jgi:RecA-family ATPase